MDFIQKRYGDTKTRVVTEEQMLTNELLTSSSCITPNPGLQWDVILIKKYE